MNAYSRLNDLREELQGAGSGTSNDAVLLRMLERVSRALDTQTQRQFYSEIDTRTYGFGSRRDLSFFDIPDDVISISALTADTAGTGTFSTTLVADTDYWLYPYNARTNEPATRIDLNPSSALLTNWPYGNRKVRIAGMFGWSNETESVGTITEPIADTTTTSVTLAPGHGVSPGDTLVIGTEQMDVRAVVTNVITVTRAINGTTAATAADNAAARRRRFPRDVEMATVMQAARFFRETQTGYSGSVGNSEFGGFAFAATYPAIRDLIAPYRRYPVAVA